MIRPVTAICMLAAGASGLFLYQTKHRAVMLDRQIMAVLKQTDATRERIGVMRAEWALLNEPDRLAELSGKHLGLRTLSPTQFVSVADMGSRLPPPDAPGTSYATAEDALPPPAPAALPMAALAAPGPRVTARPVPPQAPAAAAPVQVATAAPPRPPAPPRLARAEPREDAAAAPRPAQLATSSSQTATPTVSVLAAPIKTTRPAPVAAEAAAAHAAAPRATVAQAAWTAAPAAAAPAYQAAQYSSAAYAPSAPVAAQSALGGTRASLPPPVPYGAQPR